MERISVFDIFKVGIGPSSSHTMGPWRAMQSCLRAYMQNQSLEEVKQIYVELFGSLAKTGKGHGTDIAIQMAIAGYDPETIDVAAIPHLLKMIKERSRINVMDTKEIDFHPAHNIIYHYDKRLPFHANALTIHLTCAEYRFTETYYSVGGGFVMKEGETEKVDQVNLPFPIDDASDLLRYALKDNMRVAEIVKRNELAWRDERSIDIALTRIADVMLESIYRGCHTEGMLPGGLNVKRRASYQNKKLILSDQYKTVKEWIDVLIRSDHSFTEILNWVSCFALAVNEENASFGRVVTAPTNGAAGVVPAVMMYYLCFCPGSRREHLPQFLMVAGEIGSIFKKGATLSAAMGGCQAEIGVSSAMAAAALTECLGGSPQRVLMAAEIAMEHHLGLTCDPVAGLVQVPCIERNAMGAMKAITASHIALASDPAFAKVSLDDVVKTMWKTALDMNEKYKETSEGGLAVQIPVNHPEC